MFAQTPISFANTWDTGYCADGAVVEYQRGVDPTCVYKAVDDIEGFHRNPIIGQVGKMFELRQSGPQVVVPEAQEPPLVKG